MTDTPSFSPADREALLDYDNAAKVTVPVYILVSHPDTVPLPFVRLPLLREFVASDAPFWLFKTLKDQYLLVDVEHAAAMLFPALADVLAFVSAHTGDDADTAERSRASGAIIKRYECQTIPEIFGAAAVV